MISSGLPLARAWSLRTARSRSIATGSSESLSTAWGCGGPPRPEAPPPPELPVLRLHDPAPETIHATRDFSSMPTEEYLTRMRAEAAARTPPVYTCDGCIAAAAAARKERTTAFAKGIKVLAGAARAKGKLLEQLRDEFGRATGVGVPGPTFNRLRQLPHGTCGCPD